MDDVLHPLHCAYGAEVPGAPAPDAPPPGTPGHAEWSLLAQMRDLLGRWPAVVPERSATEAVAAFAASATEAARLDRLVATLPDAPALRPSPSAVAAVEARAEDATLAAVRSTYGETAAAPVPGVEHAVLAQGRDLLERAPRAAGPAADTLAAVLARAEAATRSRPLVADDAVTERRLAPLAVVYGLGGSADADAVETAVLAGARDAVSLLPRPRPDAAVLAAVTAYAAEASAPRPAVRVPAAPRAADRAPVAGAAAGPRLASRRVGTWTGAAALAGALLLAVVLFPRAGADATDTAEAMADESAAVTLDAAPLVAEATPFAGDSEDAALPPPDETTTAPALPPAMAFAAPSTPAPSVSRAPSPRPAAAPARAASVADAPAVRREAAVESASSAFAPVAARTPAPPAGDAWDASGELRTISMRLRALRQAGTDWDAPAEAFGAPRMPVTMSATPGLQSVRAGSAPARARVRPDSAQTGN